MDIFYSFNNTNVNFWTNSPRAIWIYSKTEYEKAMPRGFQPSYTMNGLCELCKLNIVTKAIFTKNALGIVYDKRILICDNESCWTMILLMAA